MVGLYDFLLRETSLCAEFLFKALKATTISMMTILESYFQVQPVRRIERLTKVNLLAFLWADGYPLQAGSMAKLYGIIT